MKNVPTIGLCAAGLAAVAIVSSIDGNQAAFAEKKVPASGPDKAAVERARKTTAMLDNIYKQTIVLVTDKYVNDVDDFAAGSAAVLLFENISKSGSHNVRLIDASGEPYDPENTAQDNFEQEGVKKLKQGAGSFEEVIRMDGQFYLRTVTPVPVVMEKCIMCHEHYGDVKQGEPIGAISFTVPIE